MPRRSFLAALAGLFASLFALPRPARGIWWPLWRSEGDLATLRATSRRAITPMSIHRWEDGNWRRVRMRELRVGDVFRKEGWTTRFEVTELPRELPDGDWSVMSQPLDRHAYDADCRRRYGEPPDLPEGTVLQGMPPGDLRTASCGFSAPEFMTGRGPDGPLAGAPAGR